MKLEIGRFKIESDQLNFSLYEYTTIVNKRDKTERQDWVFLGFYGKFEHLMNKILQQEIRAIDEATVDKILDTIKQTEKNFKKAIDKYQLEKERVKEKEDKSNEED